MVPLTMIFSNPKPQVLRSPYSSKVNIPQTWRRAGFSAIAELRLVFSSYTDGCLPVRSRVL